MINWKLIPVLVSPWHKLTRHHGPRVISRKKVFLSQGQLDFYGPIYIKQR